MSHRFTNMMGNLSIQNSELKTVSSEFWGHLFKDAINSLGKIVPENKLA